MRAVSPADLLDMAAYRRSTALSVFVAYAQDQHIFDEKGWPKPVDAKTYAAAPRDVRVNKFGKAYRDEAKLWLHKDMADIVVDAAVFMHEKHGWQTLLYDGLRTVDAAEIIYRNAAQSDRDGGLIAPPGKSAHNKGMAADLVQFDSVGKLVEMGGNFDHLDMETNHRNYRNLAPEVLENRRLREIAFQHAALSRGRLFAPLRSEFWDERFPENEADHWRVLESLCRCLGKPVDIAHAPMDYDQFKREWEALFDDKALRQTLHLSADVKLAPERETVIYHGDFNVLYDRDLVASGKNIT